MLEVPLALWFVSQYGPSITEVGAVTPYYAEISHRVFDPYDKWEKCERKSAVEIEYSGLNLLSISTIEHSVIISTLTLLLKMEMPRH